MRIILAKALHILLYNFGATFSNDNGAYFKEIGNPLRDGAYMAQLVRDSRHG